MLAALTDEQMDNWEAFYRLIREGELQDHVSRNAEAGMGKLKHNVI